MAPNSITGVDQFDSTIDQPTISSNEKLQQHQDPPHHVSQVEGPKEEEAHDALATKAVSPFVNQGLTNFALAEAGAKVLFATDEWFAAADNLLKTEEPSFDPDAYCEQGKVMDGWESRRRREAGHDFCVLKLTQRARLEGLEVDTAFFTGNHVPAISIEIADLSHAQERDMVMAFPGAIDRLMHGTGVQGTGNSPQQVQQAEEACRTVEWKELLPKTPLKPGYEDSRMHFFPLPKEAAIVGTHLRLNYYPDGGIARLRVWGQPIESVVRELGKAYSPIRTGRTCTVVPHTETPVEDLPSRQPYPDPELSAEDNGGQGLVCSNKHYGEPWHLIQATLGRDMGDGWETARHPDRPSVLVKDPQTDLVDSDLSDWCVLQLGSVAGQGLTRIILDTKHFRGNYPESVQVEGCFCAEGQDFHAAEWFPLVPRGRMAPDSEHVYDAEKGQLANASKAVSHVRVSIYPDGGISRVRVYGPAGDVL